jgi:chloramphenicol-sensitive protein RarD
MGDPSAQTTARAGLVCGLSAYSLWGILPLYFQWIKGVDNLDVLSFRVVGSLVALILVASIARRWRHIVSVFRSRRSLGALALTACLIMANWLIFIFATRSGHILELSLGYFINPLLNVMLGVLLLKERLRRLQMIAVALAAMGVVAMATEGGRTLWIPLALASTFSLYGLIRKITPVDPLEGLAVETVLLFPIAVALLAITPDHSVAYNLQNGALLALLGPLTLIPLFLFAAATQRLPYSIMGVIQYIAPSIQFVLAVWKGEAILPVHIVTFAFIWAALGIFVTEALIVNARKPVQAPV